MDKKTLFKVLYSIGEESCTGCNQEIRRGQIQIAVTVQQIDDTYKYEWYHTNCLFDDCMPRSESDIDGFSALNARDQRSIKRQIVFETRTNYSKDKDEDAPTENVAKWNNGCAVDPNSELEDYTHVYSKTDENGKLLQYSVTLTYVDIETSVNNFHRMQLLSANEYEYYWVFQSWGSIKSVKECSKKTTTHGSLANAVKEFESVYRDKTGNNFGALCITKFPQKYYHLDVTIMPKKSLLPQLSPNVNQLMQTILDAKQSSSKPIVAHANDLITKDMPLGTLTVNQVFDAMVVLDRISTLLKTAYSESDKKQLMDASNDFYCMMPDRRPSMIEYQYAITANDKKLNALWGEQIYINCQDTETGQINNAALYQFLNTEIETLDGNNKDLKRIRQIVKNTHSPKHDQYTLEVLTVYKVKRRAEENSFQEYQHLPNHQLLWHGTRMENFIEILLHGLKIAPEGVHITGDIFGKGIYFADMVSKSANYSNMSTTGDVRFMLLCEVALGTSQERYDRQLPMKGIPNATYQSTKGCGATVPTLYSSIDGVKVAWGSLRETAYRGLLHNEYVVYNPAQVKIKYIVEVMFNYAPNP